LNTKSKGKQWVDLGAKGFVGVDVIKTVKRLEDKVVLLGSGDNVIFSVDDEDVENLDGFYDDIRKQVMGAN